jgi:hypothetical protein
MTFSMAGRMKTPKRNRKLPGAVEKLPRAAEKLLSETWWLCLSRMKKIPIRSCMAETKMKSQRQGHPMGKSSSKPGAERVKKSSKKHRVKSKGDVEDPLFDNQKKREKKSSSKPFPSGDNAILLDDNGVPKHRSGTESS